MGWKGRWGHATQTVQVPQVRSDRAPPLLSSGGHLAARSWEEPGSRLSPARRGTGGLQSGSVARAGASGPGVEPARAPLTNPCRRKEPPDDSVRLRRIGGQIHRRNSGPMNRRGWTGCRTAVDAQGCGLDALPAPRSLPQGPPGERRGAHSPPESDPIETVRPWVRGVYGESDRRVTRH